MGVSMAFRSAVILAGLYPSADLLAQSGTTRSQSEQNEPSGNEVTAAPAAAGSSSEIIVTARKRDERLIDVPISIQAFSRAEIKAAQIDDIRDVADRSGFTVLQQVSTGAGGRAQGNLVFRGLQAVTFSVAQQSSGAAFVDGIFVSNAVQTLNTADVERVEVLKGPQNAYFGRSTFGGAVNFVTRRPADKLEAEVNLRGTTRGSLNGDASVEGPIISDFLKARLLVFGNDKVADYRAADGGELGAESTYGGALTLYATPSENLWFRARGTYQRDEDSSADQVYIPGRLYGGTSCAGRQFDATDANGNPIRFTLNRPYFCDGLPSFSELEAVDPRFYGKNTIGSAAFFDALQNNLAVNPLRFLNNTPKLDHFGLIRDVYRASLQGGLTLASGGSLAFNVGYNESRATYAFDLDQTATDFFRNAFAAIDRDLTADVRIASAQNKRLRFLLGASYFWSRNASDRLDNNVVFFGAPARSTLFNDTRNQTPAIYGSIDFDLTSAVTLSVDGRYEQEKDYNYNAAGVRFEQTFKTFLPRAIVKYQPTRDLNLYASYSKGVQPATLNVSFINATPAQQAFLQSLSDDQSIFTPQPTSTNYEIGIKQRLFNGRLSYSLAAYQINWRNSIQNAFVANPAECNALVPVGQNGSPASCPLPVGGSSIVIGNDARIRGVEFAGSLRATSNFDLALSLDYKDPTWTRYRNTTFAATFTGTSILTGAQYFNGNKLARIPDLSAVLSPSFHAPLNNNLGFYARADAIYTGRAWDSDLNIFKTPDFVRVNARFGIQRENFTAEIYATNLFNDRHFDNIALVADTSNTSFTQRGVLASTPPRREFGTRLQYKFR